MSPKKEADKGKEAEREVVRALVRAGWRAMTSRAARSGTQAGADVITDFPASIEVKNHSSYGGKLSTWWAQAIEQAHGDPAVIVHKRHGRARAEHWWVTTDLETLLRLVGTPELSDDAYRDEDEL